ncbi:MAG TPA: vitamin K epoxide reductase family protein [Thermomicrobiaceae bacterium]|nr:vitamin K epoxide reductase family protein [Thermomicrobiaceae bacterium]
MSAVSIGRTRQIISLVLALAGIVVAGYLTYVHYNLTALVCTVGNCEKVQTSSYAVVGGVPIALLGLLMYVAILLLGVARWLRPEQSLTITAAMFAIVLAGAVYAAYLTYLELAVINAICQWCVASALLTAALLINEGYSTFQLVEAPVTN